MLGHILGVWKKLMSKSKCSEGFRRLSLFLGILGCVLTTVLGAPSAWERWQAASAEMSTLEIEGKRIARTDARVTDQLNNPAYLNHEKALREDQAEIAEKKQSVLVRQNVVRGKLARTAALLPIFAVLGFALPWATVRAASWVTEGFTIGNRNDGAQHQRLPGIPGIFQTLILALILAVSVWIAARPRDVGRYVPFLEGDQDAVLDTATGRLYWLDIDEGKAWELDMLTGAVRVNSGEPWSITLPKDKQPSGE